MITLQDRARAFALQARADFRARTAICRDPSLPQCEQLHCLQMACEKLCKSHLYMHQSDPKDVESTHAVIAGPLPTIIRQMLALDETIAGKVRSVIYAGIPKFAREIELLHPSVHDGRRRQDNCEYPWDDDSGTLRVPAEHDFSGFRFLDRPVGATFLKLMEQAIDMLAGE